MCPTLINVVNTNDYGKQHENGKRYTIRKSHGKDQNIPRRPLSNAGATQDLKRIVQDSRDYKMEST